VRFSVAVVWINSSSGVVSVSGKTTSARIDRAINHCYLMVSIPNFPESNHYLVTALSGTSDRELVTMCQAHAEQGKYFTTLFCRYSAIVHTTAQHAVSAPVQADYLFAAIWRQVFRELQRVNLPTAEIAVNWQSWLIDITGNTIAQTKIPSAGQINYHLTHASPPLWCYINRALDRLPPLPRAILVMADTYKWNEQRICAYLRGEGEQISPDDIAHHLEAGYQYITAALPQDIRSIYLV
jgi:hypothetical protein